MKIISFLFLLLILPIQISAQVTQEWVSRYNGQINGSDKATAMEIDSKGNVYVTGYIREGADNNAYATLKYNSSGDQLWAAIYNGPNNGNDEAASLVVDNDGNVYVTGKSIRTDTKYEFATVKYDSNGTQQWERRYSGVSQGNSYAVAITLDNIGNIYVTGSSFENNYNYATIKYNQAGDQQWVTIFNGIDNWQDHPYGIATDDFGNVYVTGSSYGPGLEEDYATIKYSTSGSQLWEQRYTTVGGFNIPTAILVDPDGNILVTGSGRRGFNLDKEYITIKYSNGGVKLWDAKYNGPGDAVDESRAIAIDSAGNVFVTGYSGYSSPNFTSFTTEYLTVKYNPDGAQQWIQKFRGIDGSTSEAKAITVDSEGNAYVTGTSNFNSNNLDYINIKYNPDGDSVWVQRYNGPGNGNDIPISIKVDEQKNVYISGYSIGSGTGNDYATIKYSQTFRYPVFIVPGVGATYSANIEYDLGWILKRGIEPDSLQIDPLGRVYDDLIITLENLGYVKGKDLFIANYDWRIIPGPIDNQLDGHIDGLSGTSITSGQFNYGVDYLGWFIKQACERWRQDHNEELDSIDIISHSTGGLVTRTYIQSDAYGGIYDNTNNYRLPKIRNFVMIGVPNRGASKPWNPIHDNWTGDIAYRLVLSKIVNSAYQKVLQDKIVTGPDGDITKNSILDSTGNPNKELFINKYVPTIRYLLATYPFIDFGSGLTTVNDDVDQRNTILLDLNNGFDINPLNDPNGFLDSAKVTVIYGTGETTKSWVNQRSDFETFALQSFTDFTPSTAFPGNIWYKDIEFENNGDGTVPTNSSAGQFLIDTRANMIPFASGDHTGLVSQQNVQTSILDILNVPYNLSNISTGLSTNNDAVLSVVLDPVELVITDGNGNRFGFTNTSGALTEIPSSLWFGNTDGRGWVFGSVQEPINLQLTGLGENYYVMVSVEDSGKSGGVVLEGFLATGEVINYQITLDPVSVEEISSVIPKNFMLAQNYPNPFNPNTKISWQTPVGSHQTLKIYDLLGNEVATLVNEYREAGIYEIEFNPASSIKNLASGIYFYRLQVGDFVETKKMILLK